MNRKQSGLTQLLLLTMMCLGGWLSLSSGVRLLAGLTLIFSSATWLLLLKKRQLSQPMSKSEAEVWGQMSKGGKSRYIRKAVIMGLVLGVVGSSLALFNSVKDKGLSAENLEIFAAVVLISVFTCYYFALRLWEVNEKRNKKS